MGMYRCFTNQPKVTESSGVSVGNMEVPTDLVDDDLLEHLLGLPFGCIGLWADRNVAVTTNLLSVLILSVNQVLAVPHLHLLPRKVDGALLILHCHACSPFLLLVLVVENFFLRNLPGGGAKVCA